MSDPKRGTWSNLEGDETTRDGRESGEAVPGAAEVSPGTKEDGALAGGPAAETSEAAGNGSPEYVKAEDFEKRENLAGEPSAAQQVKEKARRFDRN